MRKKLVRMLYGAVIAAMMAGCGTQTAGTEQEATGQEATEQDTAGQGTAESAETADTPADASAEDTEQNAGGMKKHGSGGGGNMGGPKAGGGGMGFSAKDDPELTAMLEEVEDKYIELEYTDFENGLTVPYNLYLPKGYETTSYPMVTFITDMSVVGQDTKMALEQGYGGIIWATEENQSEHPCVVLVPEFPETIITDSQTTGYVDLVPRMIETVAAECNVDTDRLYVTGQSMGCMTFLNVTANNPDLFAAELFVSGQQPVEQLKALETQNFIYITAGGDASASGGADDLMKLFDADGIAYSYSNGWDAQAEASELDALAKAMFKEGNARNFARFAEGTVLSEGASTQGAAEHMASFDYAYRIDALRSWLFEQKK